jgi:HD-GYP domain-containing protein (c-di-GMP phosphodiesterase class II)
MRDPNLIGFQPIDLQLMRIQTIPGFDLFLAGINGPVLYRAKNMKFTEKIRLALLENNVRYLYFRTSDLDACHYYIENNLNTIIHDDRLPLQKKAAAAYDASTYLAARLLSDPSSPELMKRATNVLDNVMTLATKNIHCYKELVTIMPEDYYTHSHCANVAIYSLGLGNAMGLKPNNGLWELLLGALLHDIGKARIPISVLNKNGPLSSEEYELIKCHVIYGLQILKESPGIPFAAYPAVLQHHERLTGEGYPRGTRDIHQYGRIVAVADAFDAITTNRPYRAARSSFEALTEIKSEEGRYDPEVIAAMIQLMGPDTQKRAGQMIPVESL